MQFEDLSVYSYTSFGMLFNSTFFYTISSSSTCSNLLIIAKIIISTSSLIWKHYFYLNFFLHFYLLDLKCNQFTIQSLLIPFCNLSRKFSNFCNNFLHLVTYLIQTITFTLGVQSHMKYVIALLIACFWWEYII